MNTRSKSSLFLIELVIVILVFSLSAAVCLRLFFESRKISDQSRNVSQASITVQTVADCYKAMKGDFNKTAQLLDGTVKGQVVEFYYNRIWESVGSADDAYFVIRIELIEHQHKESTVTASRLDGNEIFSVLVRGGLDLD